MTPTLTMPEAAKELRKSRRWLQDWLRDNPADRLPAFCGEFLLNQSS